jgi:Tol biopolymer transport system component
VNKGRDNINLLDPVSGDERPLLPDSARGFVFDPRYSPDGNRLAFTWRRGAASRGLWVFDLRDSSYVRISESTAAPAAWSADGRYVYAGYPRIYRIDSQRRSDEEVIVASPFREGVCTAAAQHRPGAFVCAVSDFVSDAWLIENFDNYTP